MRDALSNVLRTLDKAGLVIQRGYEILIQTFALKIFGEKRNDCEPLPNVSNFTLLTKNAISEAFGVIPFSDSSNG